MFGLSMGEMVLLAIIALIVIGPKQLPDFARQLGRFINDLKRTTGSFAEEFKQSVRIDLEAENRRPPDPPPAPVPTPDEYAQHIAVDPAVSPGAVPPTAEPAKKDEPS